MSFTELFIRRPVMTTLVMAGILIFGLAAYRLLPVSDLPNVDFPTVTITTTLKGASVIPQAAIIQSPRGKIVYVVDAAGKVLWADRFEGQLANLFDLQDRISAEIDPVASAAHPHEADHVVPEVSRRVELAVLDPLHGVGAGRVVRRGGGGGRAGRVLGRPDGGPGPAVRGGGPVRALRRRGCQPSTAFATMSMRSIWKVDPSS